ncbi:MAG TPA: alpha/beta hydrolase [Clostridia bacterium]|nr:alpha/beta hydrolase [Clostridia bacterium]
MKYAEKLVDLMFNFVTKIDTKRLSLQSAPEGVEAICDIDYVGDNNEYHLLDIYYPDDSKDKKLPVIIDIHGGGWTYGKKEINKYYAMSLAKRGFAVVNISYRILQFDGGFPNIFKDACDAFEWVKANGKDYPFDMNNIFLTGDSAGGHIAAYLTSVSTDKELAEKSGLNVPLEFNAVGFTCAVFDLEVFRKKLNFAYIRHLHKLLLGNDYKKHPLLDSMTIRNNKVENFPPLFLSTGAKDFVRSQSLNFVKILEEKGVEFEFLDFKKEDSTKPLTHVFNVLYPERPEGITTNTLMCNFFKEHMK